MRRFPRLIVSVYSPAFSFRRGRRVTRALFRETLALPRARTRPRRFSVAFARRALLKDVPRATSFVLHLWRLRRLPWTVLIVVVQVTSSMRPLAPRGPAGPGGPLAPAGPAGPGPPAGPGGPLGPGAPSGPPGHEAGLELSSLGAPFVSLPVTMLPPSEWMRPPFAGWRPTPLPVTMSQPSVASEPLRSARTPGPALLATVLLNRLRCMGANPMSAAPQLELGSGVEPLAASATTTPQVLFSTLERSTSALPPVVGPLPSAAKIPMPFPKTSVSRTVRSLFEK